MNMYLLCALIASGAINTWLILINVNQRNVIKNFENKTLYLLKAMSQASIIQGDHDYN